MNKQDKIKGENLLKKWAEAKQRIIDIQNEINLLKNNINPLFTEQFESYDEILFIYNKLLKELLFQMQDKMITLQKVEYVIDKLDKFERNIIIFRYQKKYSWERIALENHTSRTNCFNIRNRVIKKIIES